MIYLDNAATSWPKPESVYETLGQFLRTSGANPGRASHRMAAAASSAIQETRQDIARLIAAPSPERVVFTSSATDAISMALRGLLRPNDRVITTSMEHNAVSRPLHYLASEGVEVVVVPCAPHGQVDPGDIRRVAAGSAMIVLAGASNVTGVIQPIAEIAEIARSVGALLLVDAAQTLGIVPTDVERDGIDLLAFPGHKGLLGPTGTGGLFIGSRVDLERFVPWRIGGTGTDSALAEIPATLPHRFESGTLNSVGIAGLGAGVRFVTDEGVDRIASREQELTKELVNGLKGIDGVKVFPAGPDGRRAAVVSFTVGGWDPSDVGAVLDQSFDIACRTGLHCAPDACRTIGAFPLGTIRFSPGVFTTREEIAIAVDAIREIAATPLQ